MAQAESAYNTVYISVPRQAKSFRFQDTTYSFVTEYDPFGLTKIQVDGLPLVICDREKTILDGIDRLKYVGGLEEYLKSVSSFPSVESYGPRKRRGPDTGNASLISREDFRGLSAYPMVQWKIGHILKQRES
jgi:hypothetical protein